LSKRKRKRIEKQGAQPNNQKSKEKAKPGHLK
jgi:hypothetical protein